MIKQNEIEKINLYNTYYEILQKIKIVDNMINEIENNTDKINNNTNKKLIELQKEKSKLNNYIKIIIETIESIK